MAHRTMALIVFIVALCGVVLHATITVCNYESPESRISDLALQGSFNWYDGPYADDRDRTISATLVADYTGLLSTEAFGRSLDARTEVRGTGQGWTADLAGSGSLQSFFGNDRFGVGVIGLDLSNMSGLEVDLSGGIGTGRFRDVTPLAQAIRIQNDLLDLGELLAPVGDDALLDLAQVLGEVGPTDDEKVVQLVERLIATGLVPGNELGVRGLLAVEEILTSTETRLCGNDIQARLGASAMLSPTFNLSATGTLLVRYAAVPDPVSQFDSSAEAKIRLARPEEMSIESDISYARSLPDGWTARAEYRLSIDRMWTAESSNTVEHAVSGSLTTKVFGSVGVSFVGNAQYKTGDEELSFSLAIHMEADLF